MCVKIDLKNSHPFLRTNVRKPQGRIFLTHTVYNAMIRLVCRKSYFFIFEQRWKLHKPIFSSSSVRYPAMEATPYCRSMMKLSDCVNPPWQKKLPRRFQFQWTRKPSWRWQTRATRKHTKIAPIRRVSFHFTEFHFAKFQITGAAVHGVTR